jgi:hypothetical protein
MASTQRNKDGNCCCCREAYHRREQGAPKLAASEHYKQSSQSNGRSDQHCHGPLHEKEQDQNGYHTKNIIGFL